MSHFAKVVNGIVTEVHVAEAEVLALGHWGDPALFVQTSYNTSGGVHRLGGTPLRKNFAGIGYVYDKERDAFYEPQPYPSWTLNEDTCQWVAPVELPTSGGPFQWNEDTQSWESGTPVESV
jgi:hypothetical protein